MSNISENQIINRESVLALHEATYKCILNQFSCVLRIYIEYTSIIIIYIITIYSESYLIYRPLMNCNQNLI